MTGARPRSTAAPAVDCRVLAVLRDAVLVVDLDGLVTYCNPAAEQMLGLPREDVLGTPASSLYGMRPDPALRREMIESLVRTGGWMGDVTLAPTPQRAAAVVNVHTSAVYDDAGLLTGAVAVVRDVTARRSVECEGRVLRAEVQQMLEVAPIGLCLTGTDGRVLRANDRLCRILGYPPEELVGMTYQEFTHPDDVSDSHEQVQRLLKGDGSARFEQEKRYLRGDGGEVWVRVTASLMRDEAGRPSHFVTAVEDISERKSASERLAAVAAAQLEIAGVELSPQKVMHEICRHARTLTGADGAAVQMLEDEELVVRAANGTMVHGVGLRLVLDDISGPAVKGRQVMTSPDTANDPRLTRESALAARRGHARSAVVAPLLRGDDVLGVLTVSATRPHSFTEADAQTLTLLAAPFGAALANAWHLEQVAHRAATDPLTGLPNRTRVLRSLEQALQRLPPEGGSAVALLFLDLDGFKAVNDTHGHEPGDRVLREVAERISGVVRGRDVAGRLGGDEFCVVCSDLTGAADAEALARRLVQAVSGAYCVSGDGPEPRAVIGVSVGVAIAERNCRPRDVVRAADELMYAAKQAGGNRYRVGGVSGPAGTPARD